MQDSAIVSLQKMNCYFHNNCHQNCTTVLWFTIKKAHEDWPSYIWIVWKKERKKQDILCMYTWMTSH